MEFIKSLRYTKVNIVYDDNEFTLSRKTKDYLMALLSSSFLLLSYLLNVFAYSTTDKRWVLIIIYPVLTLAIGYFVISLYQYVESRRLKDKWFGYEEVKEVVLIEKGDKFLVDFYLKNNTLKGISIYNDLYFRQFLSLLKRKGSGVKIQSKN